MDPKTASLASPASSRSNFDNNDDNNDDNHHHNNNNNNNNNIDTDYNTESDTVCNAFKTLLLPVYYGCFLPLRRISRLLNDGEVM
jgi:hypothetical protein